jgi:2-oxoisovalerate dehydrogenase E1 component beta subunit
VIIAHEDSKRGGFGAEIAAIITEHELWSLEAPVTRIAAPDTPVPYSPPLEYAFLPRSADIVAAAKALFES